MSLLGRLVLSDSTCLLVADYDPSATATDAPLGSLLLRKTAPYAVYQKTGTGGTAWVRQLVPADIPTLLPINDGNSGVAKTLDLALGVNRQLTLTGNCVLTLSNPVAGQTYFLELVQDAVGLRTVTWPAAVKWPGGAPLALSVAALARDAVRLYYNGTIYLASSAGLAYA